MVGHGGTIFPVLNDGIWWSESRFGWRMLKTFICWLNQCTIICIYIYMWSFHQVFDSSFAVLCLPELAGVLYFWITKPGAGHIIYTQHSIHSIFIRTIHWVLFRACTVSAVSIYIYIIFVEVWFDDVSWHLAEICRSTLPRTGICRKFWRLI